MSEQNNQLQEKSIAHSRADHLINTLEESIEKSRLEINDNNLRDILDLKEEAIVVITEDQFANVFMPYFCKNENPYNVTDSVWIGISGGAFKEVRVVDRVTGEYRFTVPPIYDRESYQAAPSERGQDIHEQVESARNRAYINPNSVQEALQFGIIDRITTRTNVESSVKKLYMWNIILKFYGLEPIHIEGLNDVFAEPEQTENQSGTTSSASEGNGQFQYKELD